MSKQYKIIVNSGKADNTKTVDIQPGAGEKGQAQHIKAQVGSKYILQEHVAGKIGAPRLLQVRRVGDHLHVLLDNEAQASLVIDNYFTLPDTGDSSLIGQASNGKYYEYISPSRDVQALTSLASAGQPLIVMLGGADVSPFHVDPGLAMSATSPQTSTANAAPSSGLPWSSLLGVLGAAASSHIGGSSATTASPAVTTAAIANTGALASTNQPAADSAGTTPLTAASPLVGVATNPTIAISSSTTTLASNQSATISFTLSEASTDFTASDVTVVGGTLSNFSGSGTSYTATFTPTAGASSAVIVVDSNRFHNAAGLINIDGGDINNCLLYTSDAADE